jgi:peptidylprolyl isomerase
MFMQLKKKTLITFIIAIIVVIALVMAYSKMSGNSISTGKQVTLETNMGNIVISLRDDMPITAGNFASLAGKGFYDGTRFHRVIDSFMIQGGDPLTKDASKQGMWGTGGPGYEIEDEFNGEQKNDRGTIAMANAGPNTGGSQFFINLVNNNFLDGKHPVFGKVVKGMDVVDKIAKVQTDDSDRPLQEVKIIKVSLN